MKTVVIFGAGATKACGGPLTGEILPYAIAAKRDIEREGYVDLVERFLVENFHLPRQHGRRRTEHFPSLPLLLSLVDQAVDRKHAFGPNWPAHRLSEVRDALEYTTFAILEHSLRSSRTALYHEFVRRTWPDVGEQPAIITLNYDIIADNTLASLSERLGEFGFPNYGCDITLPQHAQSRHRFGTLLKLHGSLNWLYCPGCEQLTVGIAESGRRTAKVLQDLWNTHALEKKYSCHGVPCTRDHCGAAVRPVLITPTHAKDYRNPHIAQVWYHADQLLRSAQRVIIVGYSLPEDDVDVAYLLKRSLSGLNPTRLTVVELDPERRALLDHPIGNRYSQLFGPKIDWQTDGFESWVRRHPKRRDAFQHPLPVPRGRKRARSKPTRNVRS